MKQKNVFILSVCLVVVFVTFGLALADMKEISGKISAVANEGREFTVETEGGEEVELEVSSSRTEIKQGGNKLKRSDLKEGMKVKVKYDTADDEAREIIIE